MNPNTFPDCCTECKNRYNISIGKYNLKSTQNKTLASYLAPYIDYDWFENGNPENYAEKIINELEYLDNTLKVPFLKYMIQECIDLSSQNIRFYNTTKKILEDKLKIIEQPNIKSVFDKFFNRLAYDYNFYQYEIRKLNGEDIDFLKFVTLPETNPVNEIYTVRDVYFEVRNRLLSNTTEIQNKIYYSEMTHKVNSMLNSVNSILSKDINLDIQHPSYFTEYSYKDYFEDMLSKFNSLNSMINSAFESVGLNYNGINTFENKTDSQDTNDINALSFKVRYLLLESFGMLENEKFAKLTNAKKGFILSKIFGLESETSAEKIRQSLSNTIDFKTESNLKQLAEIIDEIKKIKKVNPSKKK